MPAHDPWRATMETLDWNCPFIPHTDADRLFSTVRRMKAERALGPKQGPNSNIAI